MNIIQKIKWYPLAKDQYIKEETPKSTIYLHHTAGSSNPYATVRWWGETTERVGTAFVIGGKPYRSSDSWADGELIQAFSSKYWAYHLGVNYNNMPPGSVNSKILNSESIAIEICNFGYLNYHDGHFMTYVNTIVPESEVMEVNYKGRQYWHKYTDAQLETLRELLLYLTDKFEISREYKGIEMFRLDMRAFEHENGIWSHSSVRKDKTDIYPDPRIIAILEQLND